MNIAEKIYKESSKLPDHLAKEVLDFIEFIEKKHGLQERELQNLRRAMPATQIRKEFFSPQITQIDHAKPRGRHR